MITQWLAAKDPALVSATRAAKIQAASVREGSTSFSPSPCVGSREPVSASVRLRIALDERSEFRKAVLNPASRDLW